MLDKTNMATFMATNLDAGNNGIKQQDITVDTAVDDTDYTWTVTFDDFVVTYTINSGPSATTSSIAAQIRSALDNDTDNDGPGGVDEYIEEGAGAGAVAEVVGKVEGDLFAVASTDANLTVDMASYAGIDTAELEKTTEAIVGSVMTPATLTGDVDDYDPADAGGVAFEEATFVRINGGAANRNITGIVPHHRTLIVTNITSANVIILKHEDAGSAAANRFVFPSGADRTIQIDEAVILVYDSTSSRWRAAS